MSWNWEAIFAGAVSGGLFGTGLSVFVAPHINWSVEKERLIRADRKEKIQAWFENLDSDKGTPILVRDIYFQMKPHLHPETVAAIEAYTWDDYRAGLHEKNQLARKLVYKDLAALQLKWELI